MVGSDIEKVLVPKEEVEEIVKRLGEQITNDFLGEELIVVCILKGSCIFFSDLVREINLDVKFDFMVLSSYGNSTTSSREVKIIKDLSEDIKGKNVLVVEDIIDSGRTIKSLKELLENKYGIKCIHHTGSYDVVDGKSYIRGAYERMEPGVRKVINENPSLELAIDLHRDAVRKYKSVWSKCTNWRG